MSCFVISFCNKFFKFVYFWCTKPEGFFNGKVQHTNLPSQNNFISVTLDLPPSHDGHANFCRRGLEFTDIFWTSLAYDTQQPLLRHIPGAKTNLNPYIIDFIQLLAPFYCNLYPNPNEQYGCIDYKYDEDAALLVRSIKGDPEKLLDDWKIPKYWR